MSRLDLLVATTNAGKFREFCTLLGDLRLDLRSLADCANAPEVAEDGGTYAANALLKAETIARWSGRAALADDSGLEVDALGGEPGVHSARYAGTGQDSRANVRKLLDALAGVAPEQRTARFRCVVVVACPDGATLAAEGSCDGRIIDAPRGQEGFGYDPVFLDPASGLTFAEMSAAIKNCISHRARACARLREQLMPFLSAHAYP